MKRLHWQQTASPEVTMIYTASDFDGLVLDNEHGNFTEEQMFTLIQLINSRGKESYVRFAELDKARIRKALDAGVHGLIFSTVECMLEVDKIVRWCLYPPAGQRGQGLVAENGWGADRDKIQNRRPVLIAQIETRLGLDVLPVMLEVKTEIDYYLIGPYDLSASLGCCEQWAHPDYVKAIERFTALVPDEKKAVHLPADVDVHLPGFVDWGMVAMGMDTLAVVDQVRELEVVSAPPIGDFIEEK